MKTPVVTGFIWAIRNLTVHQRMAATSQVSIYVLLLVIKIGHLPSPIPRMVKPIPITMSPIMVVETIPILKNNAEI